MNTSPDRITSDCVDKTRDDLRGARHPFARFRMAFIPLALGALAACGGSEPAAQAPASPPPGPVASTPVTAAAAPTASAAPLATAETAPAPAPAAPPKPTPALSIKDFAAPESALYYAKDDVYLISNVNGSPSAADDNGFISRASPDGAKVVAKWIESGKNGVKLDAPKGLGIAGDTLYVADITRVRTFDLKTGKAKGEIALPGATFANDIAVSADGKTVYVSDSGIKIDDKGVTPTGTDAVYAIEKGKAKVLAKGEELGRPNGLAVNGGKLWVVTFGSGELYSLDKDGKKADAQKLPKGSLDGVVPLAGDFLISSWDAQAIYRGKPGGTFEVAIPGLSAPADIGYDTKRGRVLVPRMQDGLLEAYDLK